MTLRLNIWTLGSLGLLIALVVSPRATGQDTSTVWVEDVEPPQYFAVRVANVDRSVDWYRSVFGLEEIGGSEAEDGSWRIENLRNEHLLIEIIRDERAESVDRARGFSKVGFQVSDVETVADRVATATGDRPRVLNFERFGLRIIQIRDPDGNIIQLSSPLEPETSPRLRDQ